MKYLKSIFLNISLIIALIFLLGMVSSCKKNHDTDNSMGNGMDMEAPVIKLNNPYIHEQYKNGDVIAWSGTVTDNESVAQVEMAMWPEDDSANLLFSVHVSPNVRSYTIDTSFTVNDTNQTEYHFKVFAEDAAGNSSRTDPEDHVHINE